MEAHALVSLLQNHTCNIVLSYLWLAGDYVAGTTIVICYWREVLLYAVKFSHSFIALSIAGLCRSEKYCFGFANVRFFILSVQLRTKWMLCQIEPGLIQMNPILPNAVKSKIAPGGFTLLDDSPGATSLDSILYQPPVKFSRIKVAAKDLDRETPLVNLVERLMSSG